MWWGDHFAGGGWPWFLWILTHGIVSLGLLVFLTIGIIAVVRSVFDAGAHRRDRRSRSTGLDLLGERYARGEVPRDEYLQMKRDLGD